MRAGPAAAAAAMASLLQECAVPKRPRRRQGSAAPRSAAAAAHPGAPAASRWPAHEQAGFSHVASASRAGQAMVQSADEQAARLVCALFRLEAQGPETHQRQHVHLQLLVELPRGNVRHQLQGVHALAHGQHQPLQLHTRGSLRLPDKPAGHAQPRCSAMQVDTAGARCLWAADSRLAARDKQLSVSVKLAFAWPAWTPRRSRRAAGWHGGPICRTWGAEPNSMGSGRLIWQQAADLAACLHMRSAPWTIESEASHIGGRRPTLSLRSPRRTACTLPWSGPSAPSVSDVLGGVLTLHTLEPSARGTAWPSACCMLGVQHGLSHWLERLVAAVHARQARRPSPTRSWTEAGCPTRAAWGCCPPVTAAPKQHAAQPVRLPPRTRTWTGVSCPSLTSGSGSQHAKWMQPSTWTGPAAELGLPKASARRSLQGRRSPSKVKRAPGLGPAG